MKLKIIFSAVLLTCFFSVKGQILYTDFVPDIYLTNQPFGTLDTAAIDINQDASSDFTIYCETFFDFVHQTCCWNTNNRIQFNPSEISFAFYNGAGNQSVCGRIALDSNVWIGPALYYPTIYSTAYFYRSGNLAQCGWSLDTVPKFYPLKQTVNNDTLYGWIRIEAHPSYLIIYDAALNLVSNDSILSGQTTVGIIENNNDVLVEIFPNPISNELIVKFNNNQLSEIILYDISARKLLSKSFTNSVRINTEQLEKGLYLYEVRSRNGLCKKGKVVKN